MNSNQEEPTTMPNITYSVSNEEVYVYHDGSKHSTRRASDLEALQAEQIAALEDALEEAISIIEDAAEPSYSASYSPADMLESVGRFQRLIDSLY